MKSYSLRAEIKLNEKYHDSRFTKQHQLSANKVYCCLIYLLIIMVCVYSYESRKQETANSEDSMARSQSKFQNLNKKVNQNVDRQIAGQTDEHHQSISQNRSAIQPKTQHLVHSILYLAESKVNLRYGDKYSLAAKLAFFRSKICIYEIQESAE